MPPEGLCTAMYIITQISLVSRKEGSPKLPGGGGNYDSSQNISMMVIGKHVQACLGHQKARQISEFSWGAHMYSQGPHPYS